MKTPKINTNYGPLFGYDAKKGKELIYMGGISFRVINKEKGIDVIKDSQDTYNKIVKRIGERVSMGCPA